jgi:SAM-dependent methyltransferase
MRIITEWLDRKWYPAYERNWDDFLFRERILDQITPNSVVLDLGAGAGIVSQMNFRGLAEKVCGVDLDRRVVNNPMLDEGLVSDAGKIPYSDSSFDVVFSDNVLEHLDAPLTVYKEVNRVLKPGGIFLFKTPNKRHYMPLIARLTPHSFHQFVNRLRGRATADTFPTHYRTNTKNDVIRFAEESGLIVKSLEYTEGRPEYLRIACLSYLIGMGYERLVNSTEMLASFRIVLIGTLCKPH